MWSEFLGKVICWYKNYIWYLSDMAKSHLWISHQMPRNAFAALPWAYESLCNSHQLWHWCFSRYWIHTQKLQAKFFRQRCCTSFINVAFIFKNELFKSNRQNHHILSRYAKDSMCKRNAYKWLLFNFWNCIISWLLLYISFFKSL